VVAEESTASKTESGSGFGWIEGGADDESIPHLVLCWSREEPHRLGETAAIAEACMLGRGAAPGSSGLPRAVLTRVRPGIADPRPALETRRLSRDQLRCTPKGTEIEVQNVGRLALWHNGRKVPKAVVKHGDSLHLEGAFVFSVQARPRLLPSLKAYPRAKLTFAFGAADAFGFIGESPLAWRFREQLALAAMGSGHVLLQGESGVGKELAVATVHGLSSRAGRPFVARNAATFPDSLVDAELFGSRQGYPNSGSPARAGLIGEANGSALFLDEIGELPEHHQAHLLRVLDSGEYQPLGESKSLRSDFRLYAATNRPLSRLKHDFAARFETRLAVPDLNCRLSDVPLIVRGLILREATGAGAGFAPFVEDASGHYHPRIDPLFVDALVSRTYTHHARELAHLLRVSASSSRGNFLKLTPEVEQALGRRAHQDQDPTSDQIREALAAAGGSKTEAARLLGLKNRFALLRLMKKQD
jgi:transcriptional regulator of acetoin/glycerol metabolism